MNVNDVIAAAEQAAREGRRADAVSGFNQALRLSPENPRALNGLGNRALAERDYDGASAFFTRAAAKDPDAAVIWFNLATALKLASRFEEERRALDRVLEIDPYFALALLGRAQWFERVNDTDGAVRSYRAFIAVVEGIGSQTATLREALEHARAIVGQENERLAAAFASALDGAISARTAHCLDLLTQRRKIYHSQPVGLHFPFLPEHEFFERDRLPWPTELEAAFPVVRSEFIAAGAALIEAPYVRIAPGEPVNQWTTLNHSLDWGAVFLWKDGHLNADLVELFPGTVSALSALPLIHLPGRAPTVMFSILKPRTRIPPHNGVTNTRAVVHLPLIVPEGCGFRVGSETRIWREGHAWAFDDSIEHEAWNDSNEPRTILITDAWNPFLSMEERRELAVVDAVLQNSGP